MLFFIDYAKGRGIIRAKYAIESHRVVEMIERHSPSSIVVCVRFQIDESDSIPPEQLAYFDGDLGTILINPRFLYSPLVSHGLVASILGHELIHARDYALIRVWGKERINKLGLGLWGNSTEARAYKWQLDTADHFGLTPEDKRALARGVYDFMTRSL